MNQGHPRKASRQLLGGPCRAQEGVSLEGSSVHGFHPQDPSWTLYCHPRPLLSNCSVVVSPFLPEQERRGEGREHPLGAGPTPGRGEAPGNQTDRPLPSAEPLTPITSPAATQDQPGVPPTPSDPGCPSGP